MTHIYQYVVTDTNPPVFYLEDKDGVGYRYPVSFTDPAKQAPWLPALTPDPSIPLKPGEKERGYFQLDAPPSDFLRSRVADDDMRYTQVQGNTVIEDWVPARKNYMNLTDDTFLSKEARLSYLSWISGSLRLGVCEVLGRSLEGNINLTGGVLVDKTDLDGNININAFVSLYMCSLYGNISISYGTPAKTYEEFRDNYKRFHFEGITLTLKHNYLRHSFYFGKGNCMNKAFDIWHDTYGINPGDVHTFCLDTVNHIENCKCGLFLPFYLGLHPAAIQYFGQVDKRKPALLPTSHPLSGLPARALEEPLFHLLGSWESKWFREEGFEDCARTWVELSGEKYPSSYEEWCARMEVITGVHPDTYLVN